MLSGVPTAGQDERNEKRKLAIFMQYLFGNEIIDLDMHCEKERVRSVLYWPVFGTDLKHFRCGVVWCGVVCVVWCVCVWWCVCVCVCVVWCRVCGVCGVCVCVWCDLVCAMLCGVWCLWSFETFQFWCGACSQSN